MSGKVACCKLELTPEEVLLSQFYELIAPYTSNLFEKAYANEKFGVRCVHYDTMNELNYLGIYLMLMYDQIKTDRMNTSCTDWKDFSYYSTLFKLDCITKRFNCIGINITPLINLFNLSAKDGIGSMQIVPTTSCNPPFQIR